MFFSTIMLKLVALLLLMAAFVEPGMTPIGYSSCMDILKRDPYATSGTYNLVTPLGEVFDVYCEFLPNRIYTFIAPTYIQSMDIGSLYNNRQEVLLRHRLDDGTQCQVTIGQIEKYRHLDISVQYNTNDGYQDIINKDMGPYIYAGLLPVEGIDHYNDTQGYSVNGVDQTFTNCDGNPNAYFALLFNMNKTSFNSSNVDTPFLREWLQYSVVLPDERKLPVQFFAQFEIHMGGCGGYLTSDRVTGLTGATIGLCYDIEFTSCVDILKRIPYATSGTYNLVTPSGEVFDVYCEFLPNRIYTFIAPTYIQSMDIGSLYNNRQEVLLRHRLDDGTQCQVTIGQIEKYRHLDISVQYNTNDGYQDIINKDMGPYIYAGLLPVEGIDHYNDTQGYSVNGVDRTFTNCDGNPNVYFAFLFNMNKTSFNGYSVDTPLMREWLQYSVVLPDERKLPVEFFTQFEIHMGGCGGYLTSDRVTGLTGATIGLCYEIEFTSCVDILKRVPYATSGTYDLVTPLGEVFDVYCEFLPNRIYTFIAPTYIQSMDIGSLYNNRQEVLLRHRLDDGTQCQVTIGQIEKYRHLNISVQYNTNDGYQDIINKDMGPYIYAGLLPVEGVDHYKDTQGYSVNGVDRTFTNCDGNPNAYFALLFNMNRTSFNGYSVDTPFLREWLQYSVVLPDERKLPVQFFTQFEIHMGGCGGYLTSDRVTGLTGATIGLCYAYCTYNGAIYPVGATFASTDGCNTCWCGKNGDVYCTRKCCDECQKPVPSDFIDGSPADVIPERRTVAGMCNADIGRCPTGSCILTYKFMRRTQIKIDIPCPVYGFIQPIITKNVTVECDPPIGTRYIANVTSCTCVNDTELKVNVFVIDPTNSDVLLSGMDVTVDGAEINETDVDGFFMTAVSSRTRKIVVSVVDGSSYYIATIKVKEIPIGVPGPFDVVVAMVKTADPISIDSNTQQLLSLSNDPSDPNAGVGTLTIEAGSFRYPNGSQYSGTVELSLNFIDVSNLEDDNDIPGQFLTSDNGIISPLISDGLFALTFRDPDGNLLDVDIVTIGVRDGMTLWTLDADGMWEPLPDMGPGMQRGKRQISLDQLTVNITNARWINIDKIPDAPQCYFKARAFQSDGTTEIEASTTTTFYTEVLGFITSVTPPQRLRMYTPSTRSPATTCFSIRCADISTVSLSGFINMTSIEMVLVDGLYVPVVLPVIPRTLNQYPNFQDALSAVMYTRAPNNVDMFANFISNSTGPFYNDRDVCEASTITEPAFHFIKMPLPSYENGPDDPYICTVRVGIYFNEFNEEAYTNLSLPNPSITAVSAWTVNGTNSFYTDSTIIDLSRLNDNVRNLPVCIDYRCSVAGSLTTIYLSVNAPNITVPSGNTSAANRTFPAMSCSGPCVGSRCVSEMFTASFVAPAAADDGPGFYSNGNDNCTQNLGTTFGGFLFCFDPQNPESPNTPN